MTTAVATGRDWRPDLLGALGAPKTPENLRFLEAWQQAEGTRARFNPLATTQPYTGAGNFNSVGVKDYPTYQAGVNATVKTLLNGRYDPIVEGLRSNAGAVELAQRVADSPWGTGEGVSRVLGATRGIVDAAKATISDWLDVGAGVNIDRVNPDLLSRLWLLGAARGEQVHVVSGYRSHDEQARLYTDFQAGRRPGPVAPPGSSKHERGQAVDATIGGRAIGEVVPADELAEFGLRSLAGIGDPPHVQLVSETRYDLSKAQPAELGIGAGIAAVLKKLGPKALSRLKNVGKGTAAGAGVAAGSVIGKGTAAAAIVLLLERLGIKAPRSLKWAALWLLLTLAGLGLILLGVLRLVGVRGGAVVNVVRGEA